MKKEIKKVNNHYVPQVYLKQWATEGKIWCHDLVVPNKGCPHWVSRSVRYTSSLDYFYCYVNEQTLSYELEDWFANEIDNKYQLLIDNITSKKTLYESDIVYIAKFVASQHMRTFGGYMRMRRNLKKIFPEIVDNVSKKINQDIKNNEFDFRNSNSNYIIKDNLIPLKTNYEEVNEGETALQVELSIGKSIWIDTLKTQLNHTYEALENVSWCIYEAPNDFSWATSDDPAIFLNYYKNGSYDFYGGWGVLHTNIILPLSPKYLLFAQIGMKQSELYKKAELKFAMQMQKYIVENSFLNVYAFDKNKKITKLKQRKIDEKYFKKLKKQLKEFHETYMDEEVPLL